MIRALLTALALFALPAAAMAAEATSEPIFGFEAASGALPYRMRKPVEIVPGQTYPLVVVLHGSGQMGADNVGQVDGLVTAWSQPRLARRFQAFVVAPQVAQRSAEYSVGADGQPASRPGPSFPQLLALVDELSRTLPIDPRRIYVTGFSMGASTAMDMALAAPDRIAAVVSFAGVPPARSEAAKAAGVPMALVHGDRDTQNPIDAVRAWTAALNAAGGKASLLEVPGLGHDVPSALVPATDWRDWLFRQKR